jgi:N-glycosylase/DNA lyase
LNELYDQIQQLKVSNIATIINNKIKSFKTTGRQSDEDIYSELCYCILTANCSAESCLHIQQHLHKDFIDAKPEILSKKLREHHYRFPNTRATYISLASYYKSNLRTILQQKTHEQRREWLTYHIKGIGLKEASHFLRNIGYTDYAILDRHILALLSKHNLIKYPKNLTKKTYLTIEHTLRNMATDLQISLAHLDLYIWYIETGKILK